jgi:predicted mannosyl-3-phosphoglycerate phosphatase (HAD superfamily)
VCNRQLPRLLPSLAAKIRVFRSIDAAEGLGLPPFLFVERSFSIQFVLEYKAPLLRPSNTVVFCAIDDFLPSSSKPLSGFPEFLDALFRSTIPCVWISARNRLQLDSALRKFGHGEPFIAEGGSCVYFPQDYFHLRPSHTERLGRFIAIPVAKPQPAAAEALDLLSEQTGVTVVPLRFLSPRELIQNTGLPRNEADLIRQRDFDELFFFAGASDQDVERFRRQAAHLKISVRPHGSLWSVAVDSSLPACIRELRKLYDRAFHKAAFTVALATATDEAQLFSSCDRAILFTSRADEPVPSRESSRPSPKSVPLFREDTWDMALEAIQGRLP